MRNQIRVAVGAAVAASMMLGGSAAFAGDGSGNNTNGGNGTGGSTAPTGAAPGSTDSPPASDFIDSRITFLFSDDNVFAGPRDFSPQADFTQRPSVNTFFDNYNTRDTGQETKTDLSLYRRMTGWTPRLETEANLLIRFDLYADAFTGQGSQSFSDDGTYIQVNWLQGPLAEHQPPARPPRLYFLGFPFNADRFRLGYSYGITWGGREIFPKNSSPVPGIKFGYDGRRSYVFGGVKSHRQLNENTNYVETEYAGLAGAGIDITPMVKLEGAGGIFQKGALPPIGPGDPLAGQRINAEGVTEQLTLHHGMPIQTSVDLRLYRNDGDFPFVAFSKPVYGPGFSWLLSEEVSYLTQNLRDPDTFGATVIQSAIAADVNVKAQVGFARFFGDIVHRDLAFILFNVPSFTPYYAFPRNAAIGNQTFFDAGIDYNLPKLHQTPGVIAGFELPATYQGDTGGAGLPGTNTVVVRAQGDFDILPPGQKAYDILSARAYDRFELSDMMTMIAQLTYTLDKNATELRAAPGGFPVRVFKGPNVTNKLGIAAIFQARF